MFFLFEVLFSIAIVKKHCIPESGQIVELTRIRQGSEISEEFIFNNVFSSSNLISVYAAKIKFCRGG